MGVLRGTVAAQRMKPSGSLRFGLSLRSCGAEVTFDFGRQRYTMRDPIRCSDSKYLSQRKPEHRRPKGVRFSRCDTEHSVIQTGFVC